MLQSLLGRRQEPTVNDRIKSLCEALDEPLICLTMERRNVGRQEATQIVQRQVDAGVKKLKVLF